MSTPKNSWLLQRPSQRPTRAILTAALTLVGMDRATAERWLVKDGQARAAIVIAETPTRMQKLAAEELRAYVKKITGADLPVGVAPAADLPMAIYVGESDHTRRLGLQTDDLAHGAYRIRSGGGYFALVGRDDDYFLDHPGAGGPLFPKDAKGNDAAREAWRAKHGEQWSPPFNSIRKKYNPVLGVWSVDEHGSLNAVNDFLRWLGVRWYMPGEFGEICPRQASIAAPAMDATVRPEWAQREIFFYRVFPDVASKEEMLWQLRLGLYPLKDAIGGHGTGYLLNKWVRENQPEFFALYGDARANAGRRVKPCYSSAGLFESAVGFSRLLFDEYNIRRVSLLPPDGYTAFCQCALCKGKDTPARGYRGLMSDYVWGFINRVALETSGTHPQNQIMCYAYNTYLLPPERIDRFAPNLRAGICGGRKMFVDPTAKKAMLDIREGFLKKMPSGKISIWEYYNSGPPGYFTRIIAEDLKYLKGKVDGEFVEFKRGRGISDKNPRPDVELAASHLNLWLTTRLWWDPDAENMWWTRGRGVTALLDEYYTNFYAVAAPTMQTLVEYCEAHAQTVNTKADVIDKILDLIVQARAAAGENNIYADRVQLVADHLAPLADKREQLRAGRESNPIARFRERDAADIVVDGRTQDPFWQGLPSHELRDNLTGAAPRHQTSFKVAWAGDRLYFAIHCGEDRMDALKTPATADGDNIIFNGDSVALLLETPAHAYYHITIDPNGHIHDIDWPGSGMIGAANHLKFNTKWESAIEAAVFRGQDFWSVEASIPALGEGQAEILPEYGVAGDKPTLEKPWHFNVCRVRHAGGQPQLSAFSPTGKGVFHYRGKFARLLPDE